MSLSNPNTVVTEQRLKDFYDGILPYLGGSADAGFTPVGTIISVMGVTAPANYLACNGQVVNIADYPELANYFYQQFGSKNKFGGDGTTTFGIPDLRGEFLRGTGTNGHTNQGSGANVGTHQDATQVPYFYSYQNGTTSQFAGRTSSEGSGQYNTPSSVDSTRSGNSQAKYTHYNGTTETASSDKVYSYATRPTNTSVLYCIATKNIYMNPSLDYSTDEKVVGTWVTGETLYQRTIVLDSGISFGNKDVTQQFNILDASNLSVKKMEGTFSFTYSNTGRLYVYTLGQVHRTDDTDIIYMVSTLNYNDDNNSKYVVAKITQSMNALGTSSTLHNIIVTVQYTKTT